MSTWIPPNIYRCANFVQFLLLPPTCVLCQQRGQPDLDLCATCQQTLSLTDSCCPGCALPLPVSALGLLCGRCQTRKSRIHATVAACRYEAGVSGLITGFKYQRQLAGGRVLTSLLLNAIRARYHTDTLPDLLLPVPLHPARLRQRGYNQALLMAQDLSKGLGIACAANALQRVRATPPQHGLSAKERRRNLRGAFALNPQWDASHYRRIALIDDVVTTMSTVSELARVLQRDCAEPPQIHVWCLARA
jgi:ComF family protein